MKFNTITIKNPTKPYFKSQGFTLLEVLVALTIIAITLGAVIKTSSDQASNTFHLKQKTLAHWVAMNAYQQLLLERTWPALGKSTDSETMAKHEWHWQREVIKTPSPDSRKLIYRVYADNEMTKQVSSLTAYITDPQYLYP